MNHKLLLALFLTLVVVLSESIVSVENNKIVNVRAVNNNFDNLTIENIIENDDNTSINVYYPVTKNLKANGIIKEKIDMYIYKLKNTKLFDGKKELNISFETFKSGNYTSLKFNVSSSVGITHKTNEIFTVVYDDSNVIDIDSLLVENPDLINDLYELCRDKIVNDSKFKKYSNEEWLNKGLLKNKNTFSNFIFDDNNMIIIFNPYVIAPYVAGIFEIEISCNLI